MFFNGVIDGVALFETLYASLPFHYQDIHRKSHLWYS